MSHDEHRAISPGVEPEKGFTRSFQNRLILPLGEKDSSLMEVMNSTKTESGGSPVPTAEFYSSRHLYHDAQLRPKANISFSINGDDESLKRHSSLKGSGYPSTPKPRHSVGETVQRSGGTFTPPLIDLSQEMTRHLSLTKLKDITSSMLSIRSKEITFTVPPSISPISPRRGFGDMGFLSPMVPRRSDEVASVSFSTGSDYGKDSRATTPSPCHTKSFATDTLSSSFPGACSLGTINPDLYKQEDLEDDLESFPKEHLGRVWFQIDYEAEAERLKVTLLRAKNLPSRTAGTNNGCDPFVRLHLMPDERRCLQTKVKKKTCNPRFDEVFGFQITSKELEERALKLTFLDVVRDKRHQVIGHILYLLKDFKKKDCKRIIKMDLTKDVAVSPLEVGELQVSLCYNDNLERLTVTVGEARNIKFSDSMRLSSLEYQCRVCLMQQAKVVKSKKTEVVKSEKSPSFNESFIFKISAEDLETTAVSISLNTNKKAESSVGRVLLGSFMFARGKANEHWTEMLARRREYIQMWHSIS